jgi:hypothetical protein
MMVRFADPHIEPAGQDVQEFNAGVVVRADRPRLNRLELGKVGV